jgi:hypothetical protein
MQRAVVGVAIVGLALATACSRKPDIDEVPVGSPVQVTREDGALVEGRLTDRNADAVRVDVGPTTRAVPRHEIADFRIKGSSASDTPALARFREITVPASTKLAIRLDTPVSSATSSAETPIRGEIVEPLVVDGVTVIPVGAVVSGVVTGVRPSGRVKGRANLELQFDQLTAHGETHQLNARFARSAPSTRGNDAEKIAIPAVGGAIVGAIIGGNKGAAIGAAAGGGAGTAVVLTTAGPEVTLGEGTVLSLSAGRLIVVRIPLRQARS